MSKMDGFVADCMKMQKETNEMRTVHDYLVDVGYDKDAAEYRSLKSATDRALKEDGKYHHLLGVVFALPKFSRGREPTGFGEDPPRIESRHAPVVFTSAYALGDMTGIIEQNNYSVPSTARTLREAEKALATVSPTKQKIVMAGFSGLAYEKKIADIEAAHATREADEARKALEAARTNETFLQGLVEKLTTAQAGSGSGNGTAVVPMRPAK